MTDPLDGLKCECCGAQAIGVCSTIIPYSAAFCHTCLNNYAQPKWVIDFQIEQLERIEDAAAWFLDDNTVLVDGEYLTVRDYWTNQWKPEDASA